MIDSLGRAVPVSLPVASEEHTKQVHFLRMTALTDYLADPDAHSVRWHHERTDRSYQLVSFETFVKWSVRDKWQEKRDAFWLDIEHRVRENMADEILRRRLIDLKKFESMLTQLEVFLHPKMDKDGKLILDVETGLPQFPLKLPSMDKYMAMYLNMHERVLLLRGEVTTRTEQQIAAEAKPTGDDAPLNPHLRPVPLIKSKFSREDVRAMARAMLKGKEPALRTHVIGTPEPEDGDDNASA